MRRPGTNDRMHDATLHAARTVALAALLALLPAVAAQAAIAPSCQPVLDAAAKQLTTPSHFYMTLTSRAHPDKPLETEGIVAGGVMYGRSNGKWRRSPISVADLQKAQVETLKQFKTLTCRYLRDETVNGEAAAVYSQHAESAMGTSDSTTWISKSAGLPLKQESEVGKPGETGKSHSALRYEYKGVTPPAGLK